jgi:hypothetical protein
LPERQRGQHVGIPRLQPWEEVKWDDHGIYLATRGETATYKIWSTIIQDTLAYNQKAVTSGTQTEVCKILDKVDEIEHIVNMFNSITRMINEL